LRTDVVNDWYAGILYAFRKPQIEVRKIDENRRTGRLRLHSFRQPAKHAVENAERTDHLKRPDDRSPADVILELNASKGPVAPKNSNWVSGAVSRKALTGDAGVSIA
jgi:hypothetical protein